MEPSTSIECLFDQKKCFVVNKPGGVLSQAPPGIDSMELRIKRLFKSYKPAESQKKTYVGVPHRLDRPVSGIMLFCKNKQTTKEVSAQFQNRQVNKIYWAVVQGDLKQSQGTLVDHMRKIPGEAKSEVVASDHEHAQHAELDFEVIEKDSAFSWLRIVLKTGRTHQIRLQLASRGYAILGDHLYDSPNPFGPATLDLRAKWISLHARKLDFQIPETGKDVSVTAPLPSCWQELQQRFPKMKTLDF